MESTFYLEKSPLKVISLSVYWKRSAPPVLRAHTGLFIQTAQPRGLRTMYSFFVFHQTSEIKGGQFEHLKGFLLLERMFSRLWSDRKMVEQQEFSAAIIGEVGHRFYG